MTVEIPSLRLAEIRLLSISYRITNKSVLTDQLSRIHVEGSISYRIYARRKNSFKMRITQEIRAEGVLFRSRHEARLTCDVPISKEMFEDREFHQKAINAMLPFGSELFANLTGRTLAVPIITPGELELSEDAED